MNFIPLKLSGAYLIEHKLIEDHRGSFSRLFCKNELKKIGHTDDVVQISQSINPKPGTLRGLHYQKPPRAEIKIIKCISGAVFDVIVDLRRYSATFLQWCAVTLTKEDRKMIYVPKGFAHGFQTLERESHLIYFTTAFYSRSHEGALHYQDPLLSISWPLKISTISERDEQLPFITKRFTGLDV